MFQISLMMTIVGLAQNFVGSNNLNLLQPLGQFGTRLHGGKDSASPRYIFTMLRSEVSWCRRHAHIAERWCLTREFSKPSRPSSPLARLLFPAVDDNLLKYNVDDNQRVEPEWYLPIIPTVLVNGAEGIGTGWASKIPNYNIREIVSNIHRLLSGDEPLPMVSTRHRVAIWGLLVDRSDDVPPPVPLQLPNYKGFRGTIDQVMDNQFINSGEVAIVDSTTIEISELPVKTWTQVSPPPLSPSTVSRVE